MYLPKDYIERTTGRKDEEIEIRTKIEIAIAAKKRLHDSLVWNSKKRIHILCDSCYDSRDLIRTINELGVSDIRFVKRNFYVRIKGKAVRIDEYFEKQKKEKYFKNNEEEEVFYK